MSDLTKFLRAVKVLDRLCWKYPHERLVQALAEHASARQQGAVHFVGDFLEGLGSVLRDGRKRACRECGHEINQGRRDDQPDARSDALYCSPRCRQRAYRKRVTAKVVTADKPVTDDAAGGASRQKSPAQA